ncbi:hypothetical protein VTP01DRAFT_3933 [Rhizomucor pusillus]|uniref:uncharacterized protein n=1 Tax=Rhizomucor pusillus TaxID=4840 RepID=UPI003743FB4D
MSGIMDTAVRKATRLDYLPPKQKHLATLTALTFQYPASASHIVETLERRLRENSWIVTFKVLIIIHVLIRDGNGDRVIESVNERPSAIDASRLREKSSGTVQIENIYLYSTYLQQRTLAFRELGFDHAKLTMINKIGKLRKLSVDDGLLKETVIVQKVLSALLKCNLSFDDGENAIALNAYRLLIEDLLLWFQTVNEAIVNILEHYFAMAKPDARLSLEIYKRFARQTEQAVKYLARARQLENALMITVPNIRHAPLSLATALEEYLNDAADQPRVQQQPIQSSNATASAPNPAPVPTATQNTTSLQPAVSAAETSAKEKPQELIDFFSSLESEQTAIVQPSPFAPATTVSVQATGQAQYNPFRATILAANSSAFLTPQPTGIQPQPSLSLQPANNPFRIDHLPAPSISTPTTFNAPNVNNNFLMMQQPQQHQQPPQPAAATYNPFSAQPSQSNNPFAI